MASQHMIDKYVLRLWDWFSFVFVVIGTIAMLSPLIPILGVSLFIDYMNYLAGDKCTGFGVRDTDTQSH